ncbi:MAG: type II secretion system protein, partial [bacterium]
MRNKSGFSLIEILAVILVVGVIAGIGTTAYTGIKANILKTEYENLVTKIEIAATEYARDTSLAAVSVYTLIQEGYIASENNGVIYNPVDEKVLNCQIAYNTYIAGEYISELKIIEDDAEIDGNTVCEAEFTYIDGQIKITSDSDAIGGWYKDDVELSFKNEEEKVVTKYRWTSKTSMFSSEEPTLEINVDTAVDTIYYLYVEFSDGTFENHSIVIKIDNVDPIVHDVSTSSSWTNSNKGIHIESFDQGSGVSKYYVVKSSDNVCPSEGYTEYENIEEIEFEENGDYCLYVKDVVGNKSNEFYFTVLGIDTTPPTVGLLVDQTVVSQSLFVIIEATDEDSKVDGKGYALIRVDKGETCKDATYTAANKIEVTENGEYAACAKDKAGNTGSTYIEDDDSSSSIKINSIDRVPPVVTVTQDNEDVWAQSKIISVTATDGVNTEDARVAGIASKGYAIILSTENCETANFSATKIKTVTINATYKACVVDKAGNIGEAEIVISRVDTTKPLININQSILSPYTTVTLTASGTDTQSGVYGYYFTTSTTCSTSLSSYTSNKTASYTANTTYRVCVIDNAGNMNNTTINVTGLDKNPPTITLISQSPNSTYTSVTATVTANDSLSGVYGYYYTNSTTCSENFSSYSSTKTSTYKSNGTYRVCVIDKAGNTVGQSFSVESVDTVLPTVSVIQSSNSTYSTVTTYATGKDNLSGVYGYYYTTSVSNCSSNSGYYGSNRYNYYSSNGTYKVCVRDNAGNVGQSSFEVNGIDTTPPTVSVKTSANDGSTTITVTASDTQSGVAGYIIQTSSS